MCYILSGWVTRVYDYSLVAFMDYVRKRKGRTDKQIYKSAYNRGIKNKRN